MTREKEGRVTRDKLLSTMMVGNNGGKVGGILLMGQGEGEQDGYFQGMGFDFKKIKIKSGNHITFPRPAI